LSKDKIVNRKPFPAVMKELIDKLISGEISPSSVIRDFIIIILIYLLVYLLFVILRGNSVVRTFLIKSTILSQNRKNEIAVKRIDADKKKTKKSAEQIAEESLTIAEKALETAEEAKKIAEEISYGYHQGIWLFANLPWNKKDNLKIATADAYYYLPTASLVITATAKVLSTKTADNVVTSGKLHELQLDIKTVLEPDTSQLLGMNIRTFAFANDELRLTTDQSGLLESVNITTEDRISSIIAEISQAPKAIFEQKLTGFSFMSDDLKRVFDTPALPAVTVQTLTFTNTFYILSDELLKTKFERTWKINIDGAATPFDVDASFKCEMDAHQRSAILAGTKIKGFLTRPLTKIKLKTFVKEDDEYQSKAVAMYEIQIPDVSVLIKVPVSRASFVKKISLPKFYKGMLIENYLNKPSQVEGALSIPINVLKAIVSIPSQLLSFKIAHIQQETALNTAEQNLKKSTEPVKPIDASHQELIKLQKNTIDAQQSILTTNQAVTATQKQLDNSNSDIHAIAGQLNILQTKTAVATVLQQLVNIMPELQKKAGYQGFDTTPDLTLMFTTDPIDQSITGWLDSNLGAGNYKIVQTAKIIRHA
jgi:hypothetical protein